MSFSSKKYIKLRLWLSEFGMFWILILCFKILVCIKWLFLIFVTFVWSLFVSYDTISLSFKTSLPLVPDLSRQSHLKTFHTFVQNFLHYPPKWKKKLIYLRIGTYLKLFQKFPYHWTSSLFQIWCHYGDIIICFPPS